MGVRTSVRRTGVALGAAVLLIGSLGQAATADATRTVPGSSTVLSGQLGVAFEAAASHYQVPRDLLVALGYAQTHLDGHDGAPSVAGGYGVMHLLAGPAGHSLADAAQLTGASPAALRTDTATNIAGAAAVLRWYADQAGLSAAQRRDAGAWYGVVARYAGAGSPATARLAADTVYQLLATGFSSAAGTLAGRPVAPQRGALAGAATTAVASQDYPSASWVPAYSGNYTVANRPTDYQLHYVVIHVTQGSYATTISWFQNPSAKVSAHYVVRSSDGAITQMVREKDIAWHAGNWTYNTESIGIEHEGFVDDSSWFTDAMYRSSAALTRSLTIKYGIPRDRTHIIGHVEVPGATHTDPGPYWNWTYYMQLVNGITGIGTGTVHVSSTLNVRSGPGTGYAVVGTVANGATVSIYCQANGTSVTGTYGTSTVWDKIGTDRWVADAYVYTGYSGFIPNVPRC